MGSLYLGASLGVWSGTARLYDFGNTFDSYNHAPSGSQADALGIFWDWVMVGRDMWQAISEAEADMNLKLDRTNEERVEMESAGR